MAVEIVMPRMGLTMEEGTLLAWLKDAGEAVKKGEPLVEIETDKSTVEIEAPADGILGRALAEPGVTLPVGAVMGYLVAEGEALPAGPAVSGPAAAPPETMPHAAETTSAPPAPANDGGKVKASPAARHLARRLDVDLREVQGTGPDGRVVAWNVETAARSFPQAVKASPLARRIADETGIDLAQVEGSGPAGRILRKDVEAAAKPAALPTMGSYSPLSRTERIIAERMVDSFTSAPHFYLHTEVDARELVALRRQLLPKLQERAGVRITYTDLLVRLCALALVDHPRLMAQWADGKRRLMPDANIGIAVDTPNGLLVPVIHQADRLGLVEIAQKRQALVERAREGRSLPQDLELGLFTISNLGMFRIDAFQAILNPPQAAILAVGRLKERPIVENGQIIAAPTLNLSLSIDHRVLDGAAGARFLGDLVELLEMPGLTLA